MTTRVEEQAILQAIYKWLILWFSRQKQTMFHVILLPITIPLMLFCGETITSFVVDVIVASALSVLYTILMALFIPKPLQLIMMFVCTFHVYSKWAQSPHHDPPPYST